MAEPTEPSSTPESSITELGAKLVQVSAKCRDISAARHRLEDEIKEARAELMAHMFLGENEERVAQLDHANVKLVDLIRIFLRRPTENAEGRTILSPGRPRVGKLRRNVSSASKLPLATRRARTPLGVNAAAVVTRKKGEQDKKEKKEKKEKVSAEWPLDPTPPLLRSAHDSL